MKRPVTRPPPVVVPPGAHIGVDLENDRQRYHVSEGGVVVIGKSETAHL